jgi:histidyl-tRNA synthetase
MKLTKPTGIEDIFPDRIDLWNFIIDIARKKFEIYNFREIILPIMEYTELFKRGIGDETDIVSKEMFTFDDKGKSMTLRPEGTASVVRAYNENGEYNRLAKTKLFYVGPMFRAEKPQRGRLRQFNQFGAELFGDDNPYHDFELLSLLHSITVELGIKSFDVLINSIGCEKDRPVYIEKLTEYFTQHEETLCKNCKSRLKKNPLRILDCKEESCVKIKQNAPVISEYLCEECTVHHTELLSLLDTAGIHYTKEPYLVRGLDYYSKTTFEFVSNHLGSQNAFAAGGRYNSLVEQLGGKPKPAVGFAAGIERLFIILEKQFSKKRNLDIYIINLGRENKKEVISLVAELRKNKYSTDLEYSGGSFKSQLKKCERETARFALIVDDNSFKNNTVTLRTVVDETEEEISFSSLYEILDNKFSK